MAEYIEREALYRFLTEQKDKETGAYSKGRNAGLDVARSALHNREITPTADVVEVKRGRWESKRCNHKPQRFKNPEKWVTYGCSLCGYSNGRKRSNFCPNCGADMRGE